MKNKVILIFGGTGSFGNAFLKRIINSSVKEIRIFSRDEKKQDDMRKEYLSSKIKFLLGDVRNFESVSRACKNVDYIFNAAALKQVPSCEFYPMEAYKTNVVGSENIINASEYHKVKKVIFLSTDKAVYPINAMGISKAMMEKLVISRARDLEFTSLCITRYGNVIGSRGSVIPLFINQITKKKPITVTNENMTRFLMSIDEAIDLVIFAINNGKNGEILVQKSPATTIDILAKAIRKLMNCQKHPIINIGVRHGEKLYESLLSKEEFSKSVSKKKYFIVPPDFRDLNYQEYFEIGKKKFFQEDYSSNNTKRLSLNETIKILKKSSNLVIDK
jgi:UDP-N-acetylglucosamine 4,6-dehydratase/5-epimerase